MTALRIWMRYIQILEKRAFMSILKLLLDVLNYTINKASNMTDAELLQCNKVRVVLAFIGCVVVLCMAFDVLTDDYLWLCIGFTVILCFNSFLAISEITKRCK